VSDRLALLEAVASCARELRLAQRATAGDTGLYRMDEAPPEVKRAAEACDALDRALEALDAADAQPEPAVAQQEASPAPVSNLEGLGRRAAGEVPAGAVGIPPCPCPTCERYRAVSTVMKEER
jgi:hypothetical protein